MHTLITQIQLVAGLSFGAAYASAAWLINVSSTACVLSLSSSPHRIILSFCTQTKQQQPEGQPDTGHGVGLAASLVLTGVMGARFARTRKVMPPGVLTALGAVGVAYNGLKWREFS